MTSIKCLKSGDYPIETVSENQSKHYLQKQRVGGFPVNVSPHIGLNRIKGVIESDGLNTTYEAEMTREPAHYGIVDWRKQLYGDSTKTGRVVLTFKGQTHPNEVKVG